jgi:sugar/nucleoside kinase (ribokinase family)
MARNHQILDPEPQPEPGGYGRSESRIDVALIGHVGFATNRTAHGAKTSLGGAGYATAVAASALLNGTVGLVTQVGQDFDLTALSRLNLDIAGVAVLPGASARFYIHQSDNGTRSFKSELGVAAAPRLDLFPEVYSRAKYVHLGTAPPDQQLAWLRFLRDKGCAAQISVDMFEYFVSTEADACREASDLADLIFLNQVEYNSLYDEDHYPKAPTVLKHGPGGADFIADGMSRHVAAPTVREVDPVGAGEVLAGTYLALRARGLEEIEALSYAVSAATSSVTESGVDGPELAKGLALIQRQLPAAADKCHSGEGASGDGSAASVKAGATMDLHVKSHDRNTATVNAPSVI